MYVWITEGQRCLSNSTNDITFLNCLEIYDNHFQVWLKYSRGKKLRGLLFGILYLSVKSELRLIRDSASILASLSRLGLCNQMFIWIHLKSVIFQISITCIRTRLCMQFIWFIAISLRKSIWFYNYLYIKSLSVKVLSVGTVKLRRVFSSCLYFKITITIIRMSSFNEITMFLALF